MIGSGGHASVLLDIMALRGIKISGIIQNGIIKNPKFKHYTAISENIFFKRYKSNNVKIINGVGQKPGSINRKKIQDRFLNKNYNFISAIHPVSVIDQNINLPHDIQIMAGVVINPGCKIDSNCILNTRSIIEHDCEISENVHIAPGAVICGGVKIGSNSFVGANSTVIQGITIRTNSLVPAGKVVKKNTILKKNIAH